MNMTMSGKSLENFDKALGGFERNGVPGPGSRRGVEARGRGNNRIMVSGSGVLLF